MVPINSPSYQIRIDEIEASHNAQTGTRIMCDSGEQEFRLADDSRPAPVAIDAAPDAELVPVMIEPKWTCIPVDEDVKPEGDLVQSFYAGVPHEVGKRLHAEHEQRKAEAVSIALAVSQAKKKGRNLYG